VKFRGNNASVEARIRAYTGAGVTNCFPEHQSHIGIEPNRRKTLAADGSCGGPKAMTSAAVIAVMLIEPIVLECNDGLLVQAVA
jgi:hypothetical protein